MDDTENTQGDFHLLRYAEDGPVARITLDRPEKRNALSIALSDELIRAIGRLQGLGALTSVITVAGGCLCGFVKG